MRGNNSNSLMIGATVGSGISALAAEQGGADFLLAINAARLRNMGSPSIVCMLPTHNAHDLVESFAVEEILSRAAIPVYLGVTCWSNSAPVEEVAEKLKESGFAGAVNFPPTMLYPFEMRQILDQAGIGITREIELLKTVQDAGLQSLFYCGTRSQARAAAHAGLGKILFNFGWNAGGPQGHKRRISLEESGVIAREIGTLVKGISPTSQFFLEGGPIVSGEDLGYVAKYAPLDGYVGGSTLDRLPYATSIANRIAGFKQAEDKRQRLDKHNKDLLAWAAKFNFVGSAPCLIDFIRNFKNLRVVSRPIAIALERGLDESPLVEGLRSAKHRAAVIVDPEQEVNATRVVWRLFGHRSDQRTRLPLLADVSAPLVVLRNPHLLPAAAQRRLAETLLSKILPHPKNRQQMPLTARIVFFRGSEFGPPPPLIPELEHYFQGWTITLPPLRDRARDIAALLQSHLDRVGIPGSNRPVLSAAAEQVLRGHYWPANDLDLQRIAGLIASGQCGEEITQADARTLVGALNDPGQALNEVPNEKQRLVDALWRNGFHRSKTAKDLGISRKTLYNKMIKFGLSQ